jgi:hypothetical protein
MDLLVYYVLLFKEKKSTDPEIARAAYTYLQNHLNARYGSETDQVYDRPFLFSALFLTPKHSSLVRNFVKRYVAYNEQIESRYNPSQVDRARSVTNMTNLGLGICALYLSVLLMEEYDITLMEMKMPKDASYWTALGGAIFQSASFLYATYGIHHSHTQTLLKRCTTIKDCFSYEWVSKQCDQVKSHTLTSAITSSVGWLCSKAKEASSFVTGGLLSSPQLKRALDAYNSLTPGMRFVQSLPPFMFETSFLTNTVSKNLRQIRHKFLTSDFYSYVSSCICCQSWCEERQILETLDLFADGAIDQIRKFNDKTIFLLYYRILERSGEVNK